LFSNHEYTHSNILGDEKLSPKMKSPKAIPQVERRVIPLKRSLDLS